MAQQVIHTRVKLSSLDTSGQSYSINLYWEQIGTNTDVNLTTVKGYITDLFNTAPTGMIHPMGYYLNESVSRGSNACEIEYYDVTAHLDGTPAGAPIHVDQFQITAGQIGPVAAPEGCCAVFRYRGPYGSDTEFGPGDRPRARDRGRFYFGPLDGSCFVWNSSLGETLLSTAFLNDTEFVMGQLCRGYSAGPADMNALVQWSRKNASVKQVNASPSSVDPRPKYQRRRAKA